eukprot:scaffold15163_cov166-Amphora_coffeaeformis.AAC.2
MLTRKQGREGTDTSGGNSGAAVEGLCPLSDIVSYRTVVWYGSLCCSLAGGGGRPRRFFSR